MNHPATVTYVDPAYRYCHAVDSSGHRYFIFHEAFEQMGKWDVTDVQFGTQVEGTIIEHPKGLRMVDVRIVRI